MPELLEVGDENSQDKLSIDANAQKLDTEFQKYMTDANPIKLIFAGCFAGVRIVYTVTESNILGKMVSTTTSKVIVDKASRIMNESGADYLSSKAMPLISPLATMSNVSDMQIYNVVTGTRRALRHDLFVTYYLRNNPYKIDLYRIPSIMTTFTSLCIMLAKAKDGFALKQLSQSFITTEIRRTGMELAQQQGVMDKIHNVFAPKK